MRNVIRQLYRWVVGDKKPTVLEVGDTVRTYGTSVVAICLVGRVKEVRQATYLIEWWRVDRPESPICTSEHKKDQLL